MHDVGSGDFAKNSASGLLELFRKHGIEQGRIIDLDCGSGIWAEKLTAAGHEVIGVDQSPAMIKLARKRAENQFVIECEMNYDIQADGLEWVY